MSEIIKLNLKSKKVNVSLKNPFENNNVETEREEDYFQNQLKQNFERGYSEGQKEAMERLERDYSEKLSKKYESIREMIAQFDSAMQSYERDFEKVVVNLALIIAEKIVKREVLHESNISGVLKESVRRVLGSNDVHVKLNPADYEIMNFESKKKFMDDSYSKIKFEPDETIEQGGCLVVTEIGNVDARLSSQFSEMKKQLESIFSGNG